MRTTISLDQDVAAALRQLRPREGIGVSEAINRIARAGLTEKPTRKPFRQRTFDMGEFLVDVSNTAEALEFAEGPHHK